MFEKPRQVISQEPPATIPEHCGVQGCSRKCTIFIKQHNVARCSYHYLQDLDVARKSASYAIKQKLEERQKQKAEG